MSETKNLQSFVDGNVNFMLDNKEIDLNLAIEHYRKYLNTLKKKNEARRTAEYREFVKNDQRKRRHPDWDDSKETWEQFHNRKIQERWI